jgi:hypothetical protein
VGSTFSARAKTIADRGFRIVEWTIRKPQFEVPSSAESLSIRFLALIFWFGLTPVAAAQTLEQSEPIGLKLPPVRCKIIPTKDSVQWQSTPGAPVTPQEKHDKSTDQIPYSTNQLSIPNPKPQGPKIDSDIASGKSESEIPKTEHQTPSANRLIDPAFAGSVSPYPPATPPNTDLSDIASAKSERQTPNDNRGLPIADQGIDDIQSAIRNSRLSTDAWFQISRDPSEWSDIQEVASTSSTNGNAQIGPQPLAQVLANLAWRAQRNFVDPGIPSSETITYNFTDSDLGSWEAFTRIAQARGYRIVYSGDIVTLARSQQDPLDQVNPHMVKAEVWVWVDKTAKVGPDRAGLAIQLAAGNVAPNINPLTVRSLEPGTKAEISLIDSRSEQGENTLRLTVNPILLPNGNIQASMGIENAMPSSDGHKGVTVRRTTQETVELTPTRQVIEIGGILMASGDPDAVKQSWIRRLFRKNAPEKLPARMVVRLTVDSVTDSGTPIHSDNPIRTPGSNSGKTGLVLTPSKDRRIPELTSIQTVKRGAP